MRLIDLSKNQRGALTWLAKQPQGVAKYTDLRRFLNLTPRGGSRIISRMLETGVIVRIYENVSLTLLGMRSMGWTAADVDAMQPQATPA